MFTKVLMPFFILLSFNLIAEEKMEYPELQVTPRASERLQIEANGEKEKAWATQSSVSASALVTLIAGIKHKSDIDPKKDEMKRSSSVGLLVGSGWLLANMFMAYQYQGYSSALNKIKNMPATTHRDQLIKERLAEEEINHLGRIGTTMKWASFATNALAGGYMISKAKKNSMGQVLDGVAIVTSFLPIIFSNHYEDVAREQQNYKKKIFGTISSNFLIPDPKTNKWVPGVGLIATF
jgi:hypothetical protein